MDKELKREQKKREKAEKRTRPNEAKPAALCVVIAPQGTTMTNKEARR
jgi:hypothetical protein